MKIKSISGLTDELKCVMSKLLQDRDFTLIELLTVLCVIMIMASILLPSLVAAREAGKMTSCRNKLSQIGKMNCMYASDFLDWLPNDGVAKYGNYFSSASLANVPWGILYNTGYLGTVSETVAIKKYFYCPSYVPPSNNYIGYYLLNNTDRNNIRTSLPRRLIYSDLYPYYPQDSDETPNHKTGANLLDVSGRVKFAVNKKLPLRSLNWTDRLKILDNL